MVFFSIGGTVTPLHTTGYGPVDITLIAIYSILDLSYSLKLLNEILLVFTWILILHLLLLL